MTRRYSKQDLALLSKDPGARLTAPKRRHGNEESRMQKVVIKWWSIAHIQLSVPECLLFAIPNGGSRSIIQAVNLKREGVRAGIPDLFLSVPRRNRFGLFLELKTETGKLSPEQDNAIRHLRDLGYAVSLCRSSEEAIESITQYLVL